MCQNAIVMKKISFIRFFYILLLGAGFFIQAGSAAPVVFTIDNSQSNVAASGVVAGATFSAQGSGALTTSYKGSINAVVSGSTIQFTGGSTITAQNSGSWLPDENSAPHAAPANYGPEATLFGIAKIYGALRNIVLDVNSSELNITGGGSFNGTNLVFSSTSAAAVLDYYSSLTSSGGSVALNGYATNAIATGASLTNSGGTQTLVIPIDATYSFTLLSANDTTVHLKGQLVATSSVVAPPIIHSLTVTNQNVVVTVENATAQSQLQVSTNLMNWSPSSAVISTNNLGWIVFTTPMNTAHAFFRVEQ